VQVDVQLVLLPFGKVVQSKMHPSAVPCLTSLAFAAILGTVSIVFETALMSDQDPDSSPDSCHRVLMFGGTAEATASIQRDQEPLSSAVFA